MKFFPLLFSVVTFVATSQSLGCKVVIDAGEGGAGGSAGAGGSSSSTGGSSNATDPEVIVTGRAGVLAVDDTHLYIGDTEPVPFRVAKSGGVPTPILPVDTFDPEGGVTLIALDATNIYWVTYIGGQPQFQVWAAPKDGSSAATLLSTTVGPNNAQPFGIAVDDAYVYLTLPDIYNSNDPPELLKGAIHRVSKTGGTPEVIADVFNRSLTVNDTYLYWPRIATDNSGELIRADKDGSNATIMTKEIGPIMNVLAKEDRVVWTFQESLSKYVLRMSVAGNAPTTLASSIVPFGSPVIGSDGVYWVVPGVEGVAGAVFKSDFNGVTTKVADAVASQVSPIYYGAYGARLAVDDTSVFFSYEPQSPVEGAARVYRAAH